MQPVAEVDTVQEVPGGDSGCVVGSLLGQRYYWHSAEPRAWQAAGAPRRAASARSLQCLQHHRRQGFPVQLHMTAIAREAC